MAAKDTEDRKTDEQDADLSLDMSQAAVKKMIAEARAVSYTHLTLPTIVRG